MDSAKVMETAMLVCFNIAWLLSLLKSWRARTAKNKNLILLLVFLVGCAAGIAKVLFSDGTTSFLLLPYSLLFMMALTDICLYFRNLKFDREHTSR